MATSKHSKSSFENCYEDFSNEAAAHILNETMDGISERFLKKIQKFTCAKLETLSKFREKDIFCDGSIYTGSAGIAMYHFMLGLKQNKINTESLKTALHYLRLDNLRKARISFLCGDAGPLALATVISYKLGARRPEFLPEYTTLVNRLISLSELLKQSPDEILYGKSGYLYALLFVNKYLEVDNAIPPKFFGKIIKSILKSGKQFSEEMKSESPLLWQWHDKIYFGAAHGMAGILYMLLQAHSYVNKDDMRTLIKPSIDWLLSRRFQSGNFPSSMGSSNGDKLVQWCHGAPGFVPLCIAAAKLFEEEKYMKIAEDCCDVIWERGLCTKGYSLCHGVAGNAYSFIQMYQATKNPVHLYRACCFFEWCALERPGTELHRPDRPASLFEGLTGQLYLAEDITNIHSAGFPGFTI